ncbi:heme A synthase [Camelliibacillus cellulosilyticus]|uniref:Heme A synthase n=1 Tax=Camelliibacillus cellulosilyticus TaxID=2174486 RepID=A0ABV9GJF9_9BACL
MDRVLRYLGVLTTFVLLVVVIMGAVVTNTGSELGCGHHWPLCYGQVVPKTTDHKTWIEFSHRAVSTLAGILVVIFSVWSWIKWSHVKGTKFFAVCSVLFVVLQGLLGAAAVIWSQSSFVLALHFGISLISFASPLLLTVIIYEQTLGSGPLFANISGGNRLNLLLLAIYSYIVIYSGAFVRHTDSALGCPDFPLCTGKWVPDLYSRAGVQFLHRVLAGILVLWIIITLLVAVLKYRNEKWLTTGATIAILCVLLQAASGVMVIYSRMALVFLLFHSLFVTLLFGVLSYMMFIALRRRNT